MMKLFLFLIWTYSCSSFLYHQVGLQRNFRWNNLLHSTTNDGEMSADVKDYMAGPEGKKWKGTREVLPRRKQIPSPDYTPQDVCRIVLSALQNNDDPQLDHGACVVLEFKSPTGPLAEGGLDPAGYGRFIRDSDYNALIDFKSADMIGEPVSLGDSLSVRQSVKITDWQSSDTSRGDKVFDFYLTNCSGQWLIDVILCK